MDLQKKLTEIGFTEYEAKVYLAMLRVYPATGYQLSKESGVPRSMVYETLKRLHARGAALETIEGRSTLYRPLPPEALLAKHAEDVGRLLGDLHTELGALYEKKIDNRVWTIKGETAVNIYAAKLINEAQEELYLVLTDDVLAGLNSDILAAHDRGVDLNVLLTGESRLEIGRVAYHPPLESELQDIAKTIVLVADSSEALIGGDESHKKKIATVTRNADFVMIARQFVWMEMFTQRIYSQIGSDLLDRLNPEDRRVFESLNYGSDN
ncbi:MAG: TrmB family transcriptional regulator [Candidatus Promineifilaceae bacterium]|jgi:HTH-type transcriptional regulator, sugar sensing transcriptional regulator